MVLGTQTWDLEDINQNKTWFLSEETESRNIDTLGSCSIFSVTYISLHESNKFSSYTLVLLFNVEIAGFKSILVLCTIIWRFWSYEIIATGLIRCRYEASTIDSGISPLPSLGFLSNLVFFKLGLLRILNWLLHSSPTLLNLTGNWSHGLLHLIWQGPGKWSYAEVAEVKRSFWMDMIRP